MKKNNTAQKAIVNAEEITKALKESTKKTLAGIVNEAISNIVKESDEDEKEEEVVDTPAESEPVEDDTFEEKDVETEESDNEDAASSEDDVEAGEEPEDDEWSEFDDFKVGDNDYNIADSEDEDLVLKIYNKLDDEDELIVKKGDEEGTLEFDNAEGETEFVIDVDDNEDAEDEISDLDIEVDGEDPEETEDGDIVFDVDLDAEDAEDEADDDVELDIEFDEEDDDDVEELDENIGFEPVVGNKAIGKGNSKPFDEKTKEVNECDTTPVDTELDESGASRTSVKKSHVVKGDKKKPEGFPARGPQAQVALDESFTKKLNAYVLENKKYKKALDSLKDALMEAATLNVNYGKIVSLLVNESTTKDEKQNILKRFSNVKTIEEGTQLYKTIKGELSESTKSSVNFDKTISASSSKNINETTIYSTRETNPALDLMARMDNLFQK